MKTAITIPDPLLEAADALATRLGKSTEDLIADALEAYLARHRLSDDEVTARLDAIFDAHPVAARGDPAIQAAAVRILRRERW